VHLILVSDNDVVVHVSTNSQTILRVGVEEAILGQAGEAVGGEQAVVLLHAQWLTPLVVPRSVHWQTSAAHT
jgi:hypothetical protein